MWAFRGSYFKSQLPNPNFQGISVGSFRDRPDGVRALRLSLQIERLREAIEGRRERRVEEQRLREALFGRGGVSRTQLGHAEIDERRRVPGRNGQRGLERLPRTIVISERRCCASQQIERAGFVGSVS